MHFSLLMLFYFLSPTDASSQYSNVTLNMVRNWILIDEEEDIGGGRNTRKIYETCQVRKMTMCSGWHLGHLCSWQSYYCEVVRAKTQAWTVSIGHLRHLNTLNTWWLMKLASPNSVQNSPILLMSVCASNRDLKIVKTKLTLQLQMFCQIEKMNWQHHHFFITHAFGAFKWKRSSALANACLIKECNVFVCLLCLNVSFLCQPSSSSTAVLRHCGHILTLPFGILRGAFSFSARPTAAPLRARKRLLTFPFHFCLLL